MQVESNMKLHKNYYIAIYLQINYFKKTISKKKTKTYIYSSLTFYCEGDRFFVFMKHFQQTHAKLIHFSFFGENKLIAKNST